MNTPHISEQEVCLYVDALKLHRTAQLPHDIVSHVSDCKECKMEIMRLYDVLKSEDYGRAGDHPFLRTPGGVKKNTIPFIVRLAAAIVLLLGAGLTAYLLFVRNAGEPPSSSQSVLMDSAKTDRIASAQAVAPSSKRFAANFNPSLSMEDLVGANMRAASITVESPANGQVVTGKITFRWKSPGKMTYTMRILTNREEEIFHSVTDRNTVLVEKRLDPGLYYWTLLENGELVHVGKFTVPLP